jgi:transcriptional regulator with XRE-family HTH domain
MDFQDTPHPEAGGPAAPMPPVGPPGIGAVLRQTRIAQGLSLFVLAHELNLSVAILEAVEAEAWNRLPQGRERPHIRQIAERLGVDLASFPQQWSQVPGAPEQEAPDPRREALERVLVSAITVGSLGLLLWLVVPGPSLKRAPRAEVVPAAAAGPAPWAPKAPSGPYPVVGEVLPEVPVNEEGVLVTMRAMDSCQAVVQALGGDPMAAAATAQRHTLRVSEPWRLRVKGPFSIALDNAGVVALEVAGHRIRPGRTVGEPWLGKFGPTGEYLVPVEEGPRNPPTAPETDPSPLDAAPNDSEGE